MVLFLIVSPEVGAWFIVTLFQLTAWVRISLNTLNPTQNDLSKLSPSASQTTIKTIQKEINWGVNSQGDGSKNGGASNCRKRGVYRKILATDKVMIGEYAHSHGVIAAIRHSKQIGQFVNLKESNVWGWQDAYSESKPEAQFKSRNFHQRPLLLGEEMKRGMQCFIKANRKLGTAVSTKVVMGIATGVVMMLLYLLKMVVILASQKIGLNEVSKNEHG